MPQNTYKLFREAIHHYKYTHEPENWREGRNQFAEQMARERQESAAMNAAGVEHPGYGGVADGERRGGAEDAPEVEKQTSNR